MSIPFKLCLVLAEIVDRRPLAVAHTHRYRCGHHTQGEPPPLRARGGRSKTPQNGRGEARRPAQPLGARHVRFTKSRDAPVFRAIDRHDHGVASFGSRVVVASTIRLRSAARSASLRPPWLPPRKCLAIVRSRITVSLKSGPASTRPQLSVTILSGKRNSIDDGYSVRRAIIGGCASSTSVLIARRGPLDSGEVGYFRVV